MTSRVCGRSYLFFLVSLLLIFTNTGYAAPGDLDPTFGVGGKQFVTVFNSEPIHGNHNIAEDIVVQPDGKILVAGAAWILPASNDMVILRFNPDGTLDSSFAAGGIFKYTRGLGDHLYGIALQPDGKIVAAGKTQVSAQDTAFIVIRLNSNGTFDPTFGANGVVVTNPFSSLDQATEVAIQPDGKIIASGWVAQGGVNNGATYDFALVRYLPNGSVDPSFGNGGIVFTDFFGNGDLAQALVLQPDGKLVVTGFVTPPGPPFHYDFGLARYNPDGSLDTTFGTGGKVATPIRNGLDELARGIARAPDGKLVVTGDMYNPSDGQNQGHRDVVAVRYNPDGTLDTTFDGDGKFIYDSGQGDRSEGGEDVVVQPDGKILIAAKSHLKTESVGGGMVSHTDMLVIRLTVSGSFDPSFGSGGLTFVDFGEFHPSPGGVRTGDRGKAIALQPDGKIVVAGEAVWGNGDYSFCIARFLNDIGPIVTRRAAFDFDGDGRADQAVFRASESVWYLLRSNAGFSASQFGISSDAITPGDFDGDGRTDLSVYRNGTWYWLNSSNGTTGVRQFGQSGDIPVPADFTGDGRSELAIYRGGVWWTFDLAGNQSRAVQFGLASDKPVLGDFDGDARTDFGVYRDGVWYWLRSSDGGFAAVQFGLDSDIPTVGDYDGDGRADPAIYRSGAWHVLGSTRGHYTSQFGISSDVPVPADYDGDGKTDPAVYRDGVWWIQNSNQSAAAVRFGIAGDQPIPSAFAH